MNFTLRNWALPLVITLACIAIAYTEDAGRSVLQYLGPESKFEINDLSYRWVTGHFTHIGWKHTGLNILGLTSIWAMYGGVIRPREWLAFLLICAVGISLGFNLFSPQIVYYVGLSGLLHGMLAAAVTLRLFMPSRTQNQTFAEKFKWEEAVVFIGLWTKIAYEQTVGSIPMTSALAGDTVVIAAHLYGACIGTIFALVRLGHKFINHNN